MKRVAAILLSAALLAALLCGCGDSNTPDGSEPSVPSQTDASPATVGSITVTSESIDDYGYLSTKCYAAQADPAGLNKSPQLSWTAVDGAAFYAVYMIDISAGDWLHWHASGLTGTSLAFGGTPAGSEYIGPYPPSGTHEYKIIVFALAAEPDAWPGFFDAENEGLEETLSLAMDRSGGASGNLLATGSITGACTAGVTVD